MDYHMMVRLLQRDISVIYVDATLAKFRFHSHSKTVGATEEFRLERVPMLRSMNDVPIMVEDWEWDREQAKRLVDVARHALGRGDVRTGLKFMAHALQESPFAAMREACGRTVGRLMRRHRIQ